MKCSHIKDLLVIDIFGKLTPSQRKDLKEHIQKCPSCRVLVRKSKAYSGLLRENEGIPVPDWDQSWQIIRKRSLVKNKKDIKLVSVRLRRWIVVTVTCCCVFILGYYIGKRTLWDHTRTAKVHFAEDILHDYSECMELLFIDFSNKNFPEEEEVARFRAEIITEMMLQTRLLKLLAVQNKYSELEYLLEDMEMILVSISNLRPEDQDSRNQLNQLIQQGTFRNRLRALSHNKIHI